MVRGLCALVSDHIPRSSLHILSFETKMSSSKVDNDIAGRLALVTGASGG